MTINSCQDDFGARASLNGRDFRRSDDVRRLASTTGGTVDQRQQAALTRLDKQLREGSTPRQDVPRGFYLDIKV